MKRCDLEAYERFKTTKKKNDIFYEDHKKTLTADIINDFIFKYLIIGCGLPYRLVECEAFRNFMSLICKKWKPTSRTKLLDLQKQAISKMCSNLKSLLLKIRFVSLTLDVWTDRRLRSFLGITIHFLNENFEFKTYVLRCKYINDTTGIGIKRELDKIIDEFAIREKLVRIVTDNGSNMVKMGRLMNLVGEDEFDLTEPIYEESSTDTEGEITSSEDEIDLRENITESDILQNCGFMHLRCFAHSLQLVVKKSLLKINNIKRILTKCTKISAKYRQKKCLRHLAEKNYNSIPKPIKVRWNSEINCLRAICKIKLTDLNDGLKNIDSHGLILSQNEHSRLADVINILEPFEYVTNEIQGEQYSTLSLVAPSLLQLIQHLDNFIPVNISMKLFINELRNQIKTRFSGILDLSNKNITDYSWYISSFLDPLFKNDWLEISVLNSDEKLLFSKRLEEHLYNEWKSLGTWQEDENSFSNESIPCSSNQPTKNSRPLSTVSTDSEVSLLKSPSKRRKFFSFLNKKNLREEVNDDKLKFKNELEQYMKMFYNEDNSLSNFWLINKSKFPALATLAQKYLSIPASSGPVERLFSKSGYINRPHRSRLTAKNLEDTTLLSCNMDLMRD